MDDPYGIRTRDTAVKGRCLNRLTNGPILYLKVAESEGFEPSRPRKRPTRFPIVLLRPLGQLSMAPQVGFEPTTDRLTADCSTTELLWNDP